MKTTNELIEKYLLTLLPNQDVTVYEFDVNGSVIKIQYSKPFSFTEGRDYDNHLDVDLLDYITFVFNLFPAEK